ncbi:MAG: hypothetical protein AB7I52_18325 [Rhizobiaceae bacterium]
MRAAILAAIGLTLVSSQAFAISRYQSQSLSCDSIHSKVMEEGAVILRYASQRNPGLPLYDRYVASGRHCSFNEYAQSAWVPASDTGECPVLRCATVPDDDFYN